MNEDLKIEFGELYLLKSSSTYWVVNAQREMKFCDGNPIIVKIEHSFRDMIFFGHLQDGGYEIELEFKKEDIIKKYEEKETNYLNFFKHDLLLPLQNTDFLI